MADEESMAPTAQPAPAEEVNIAARIVEATKLRALGQYDDAMRIYAAIARAPMPTQQSAKILELLGDTLMQANRAPDAVTVYKKAYDTAALMNLPSKIEEAKTRAGLPATPPPAQQIPTFVATSAIPVPTMSEQKLTIPDEAATSATPLLDSLTTRPVFAGDDEPPRPPAQQPAPRKFNAGGLTTGTGIIIILVCAILAVTIFLVTLRSNQLNAPTPPTHKPTGIHALQQPTGPSTPVVIPYKSGSADVSAPK